VEVDAEGNAVCSHPLLVPDNAKENCVFPGRIDIGEHFLRFGGVEGMKEDYDVMLARLQSFGVYNFNPGKYEIVTKLFNSDTFQGAAKSVCPADKQFLDPFQFNFIMQVPGQSVALHLDAPYFWGASRFHYPQWLLAAMVFSGKFQEHFIDQVQVVAYLHEWEWDESRAGTFVYWNESVRHPLSVRPIPLDGSVVDGSKTVHAASIYRPADVPPVMNKDANNKLQYHPDSGDWTVSNDTHTLRTYSWDDLRISIVYRARCFADEAERDRYHATKDNDVMELDHILRTLAEGLVERKKVKSVEEAMAMDRLALATLILRTYITYPRPPTALIPYNYCALPKLLESWGMNNLAPAAKFALQAVC